MTKQAFLEQLRKGLSPLSQKEREERINFYSEMIDDRMEEGLTEEAAVAAIGDMNTIIAQITADSSIEKPAKQPKKPNKAGTIALLVLGAPIWLSLLVAAFAVALSLYVVFWAVIIVFWSIFVTLIACAVGGVIVTIAYIALGDPLIALAILGGSLVCAGVAILLYFACKAATAATVNCTKKLAAHACKQGGKL